MARIKYFYSVYAQNLNHFKHITARAKCYYVDYAPITINFGRVITLREKCYYADYALISIIFVHVSRVHNFTTLIMHKFT